ncbi:MAG: LacI family transcriptional regulator [Proteobacteria bacterium]|nr:LacI family transcriptional regulator [Pseudomonadota bacterium]MBU4276843.1 LacI family transcriptional regulator [Pseudomonadota bacterium]MBU4384198.1 LacI family transcriptional regulator [Pseudomonadota bacterium]MBU4603905.1 LacI family transcriptional regulator [Pseudomonadota bacterium]MCG2763061.1 LacI family transcriptional regulator [Desulfarculaceae bacterium]
MSNILEIAKLAHVSCSTVSRALNGRKGVSDAIRAKIVKLAQDLDYYPDSSARALVSKRVGVIGLIIPRTSEYTFTSPYYSHILLGISAVVTERGYQVMLVINERKSYAAFYHRRMVDGILVVGNHVDDKKIWPLTESGIPSVVVPGFIDDSPRNPLSVNSENYDSNYQAVSHLIELGHRRIAFILGYPNSKYSVERIIAYQDALRDHGLEYRVEYTPYSDFSVADGFRVMGNLLDLPKAPTAVLCLNDSISIGALDQIKSRNLRIPEELSVVVTCASDMLAHYDPPLSTIKVPVVSVGKAAASALIEMIETGSAPREIPKIPSTFTIRKSTGPCPRPE